MYFNERPVLISAILLTILNLGVVIFDPNTIYNSDSIQSLILAALGTPLYVLMLRFITEGCKKSKDSPYHDIPFNTWSYIWRAFAGTYIALFPVAGILYLLPIFKMPVFAFIISTVFFFIASTLLFAKNRKKKFTEVFRFVTRQI